MMTIDASIPSLPTFDVLAYLFFRIDAQKSSQNREEFLSSA